MTDIVNFGGHTNMNVEEALDVATRKNMTDVLILGYSEEGKLIVTSSRTNNANALFMVEVFKQKIMTGET